MKLKRIGRTLIFSFPELEQVNIVVIYGDEYTYICDTFLGPTPMEEIKRVISSDDRNQPIIVFNSHSDWDHVWGNCAFEKSIILSHEQCRINLEKQFWGEFEKNKAHAQGDVKALFPNVTFKNKIVFANDEVEFLFTPGHSNDSASCYDRRTELLYVADNVEAPIPYIQSKDLNSYINTLEAYKKINPSYMVIGHGNYEHSHQLVDLNIDYLWEMNNQMRFKTEDWEKLKLDRHRININFLNGNNNSR